MEQGVSSPPRKTISCRRVEDADLAVVGALLSKGFPDRDAGYWDDALGALSEREVPEGYPRYGFLIESDGAAQGVILVIFSTATGDAGQYIRCNVSSWFVEPAYRNYAAMLTSAALSFKEATYLNVSPAPGTWPILDAQGYRRYSNGQVGCIPALAALRPGVSVREIAASDLDPDDRELAGALGGSSRSKRLILEVRAEERRLPFVFLRRDIKHLGRCVGQLVYCRDTDDFLAFAGPIGRALLIRGLPMVLFDAQGPVPGLVGRFFNDRSPKYFKGPHRPRLNDLTHTEAVLFGV